MERIGGNIVDVCSREIFSGEVVVSSGVIVEIVRNDKKYDHFICPGFVDAHVHIESSMLTPVEFSRMVISKGTVAVLNDPHEIANVLGKAGVQFMLEDSKKALVKMFFGIPSCVPATPFDRSGCVMNADDVEDLAKTGRFIALSEVMNVPGVLGDDAEVVRKIAIAKNMGLRIDGHAPGLRGECLEKYIAAGVSTDHECTTAEEAEEKILKGMKVLIREGSAARNYDALRTLIRKYPREVMFCTDDAHPDDILENGHIDRIVRRALEDGFDLFDVLKIATFNPVEYYGMTVGMLRKGDFADFVIFENLETFKVLSVYIDGVKKYQTGDIGGKKCLEDGNVKRFERHVNNFNHDLILKEDLKTVVEDKMPVIKVTNGEIVTQKTGFAVVKANPFESDIEKDILKIVYLNRYCNTLPKIAFITGFELQNGAFATSIAHDSHNILAVGCCDQDIVDAVNQLIRMKGGLVVKNKEEFESLPLPIGGIMSDKDCIFVAERYKRLNDLLKTMGCKLDSPFMTLAFMSLIVIPELKIGEEGLFDFYQNKFI